MLGQELGVGKVRSWEEWVMTHALEGGISGVTCGLSLGSSHVAEVNLLDS